MTDEELLVEIKYAVDKLNALVEEAAQKHDITVMTTPTNKKTYNDVWYMSLHIDAFSKRLDKPLIVVPK